MTCGFLTCSRGPYRRGKHKHLPTGDREPKSNQNPRYLRYSNAVSALLWIIDDIQAEEAPAR